MPRHRFIRLLCQVIGQLHCNVFSEFFNLKQFNMVLNDNETVLDLVLASANCGVSRSLECLLMADLHHPPLDISLRVKNFQSENFPCNSTEIYQFKEANYPPLYDCLFQTD